jgi:hypothetical protein
MKRVRNWTISHQYFVVPGGPNWTHSANHEGSDAGIECRHVCGELGVARNEGGRSKGTGKGDRSKRWSCVGAERVGGWA